MRHLSAFLFVLLWQVTFTPLINVCPQFGVPVAGFGYDTTTWADYELDAQAIQAVLNINGEHYGTHPCAAILMSAAEYESLLGALRG